MKKAASWFTGLGLILFAIHNESLTTHNSDGEATLFLPWIGVIFIGIGLYCAYDARLISYRNLGPKALWIPMMIIIGFIALRLIFEPSTKTLAEIGLAIGFFHLYLMARSIGKEIFYPIILFAIIQSIIVIIQSVFILNWSQNSLTHGGILSDQNYDLATGFEVIALVVGAYVISNKVWRYTYMLLVIVGLLLLGSSEAVFALAFLFVCIILRRDWSRELLYICLAVVLLAIAWLLIGGGTNQYERTWDLATEEALLGEEDTGRTIAYSRVADEFDFFGRGFELFEYEWWDDQGHREVIVHNTPLVVLEQIGPIAALAWLWITLYCLWRFKAKYIILGIISVCVWDHYIWTTLAPYWWVLIGIVSVSDESDLVFKKVV